MLHTSVTMLIAMFAVIRLVSTSPGLQKIMTYPISAKEQIYEYSLMHSTVYKLPKIDSYIITKDLHHIF